MAKFKQLTDRQVQAIVRGAKAGRYMDGDGLHLFIPSAGAHARWVLRVQRGGRRRDIGLGAQRHVSLREAREAAASIRRELREGKDPVAERRARRAAASLPTFAEAARRVHDEFNASWRNVKHRAQWLSTMEAYVFPALGQRRVDAIDAGDIANVLKPIWLAKPETARRVRQRIGTVLDWSYAHGWRTAGMPGKAVAMALPKQGGNGGHFAALPFAEVPAFVASLRRGSPSIADLALEFAILTAARSGEVRGATWSEIDFVAKTWTVPAARMKGGKDHTVPLSDRAVAILEKMRMSRGDGDLVFPSSKPGKPLSENAWSKKLPSGATAHGFRSGFRDWAAETTATPADVVEMALAHTIKNKVERAYRRGDLLVKRRRLMESWATYCDGHEGAVVPLHAKVAGA